MLMCQTRDHAPRLQKPVVPWVDVEENDTACTMDAALNRGTVVSMFEKKQVADARRRGLPVAAAAAGVGLVYAILRRAGPSQIHSR
jgi:hypothetical protein